MKLLRKLHWAAFGAILFVAAPQAHANQDLVLDQRIQEALIAAKPVRGPGVDKDVFNGKPTLVTFFASW